MLSSKSPFIALSALLLAIAPATALAGSSKVNVCHDGRSLSVSSSATSGHEGHGDWLVTDEVCEDGIDNDCDGIVDDGCPVCPCYTAADLYNWFDAGDQCYDYQATAYYGNGTYLAYYTGEGLEAGVADYYYDTVPFCAAVNLTTFAGRFDNTLTAEEYADCAEIVLDVAAELDLACAGSP